MALTLPETQESKGPGYLGQIHKYSPYDKGYPVKTKKNHVLFESEI